MQNARMHWHHVEEIYMPSLLSLITSNFFQLQTQQNCINKYNIVIANPTSMTFDNTSLSSPLVQLTIFYLDVLDQIFCHLSIMICNSHNLFGELAIWVSR